MEGLEKSFIEEKLRNFEKDDTIRIKHVRSSPACEVGNNFASIVSRVRVKGYKTVNNKKEDYEKSFIVKQLPRNQLLLTKFHFDDIFKNEMLAYNLILPELKKYSGDGKLPVADCIYADETVIMLQDLKYEGYSNVDKRQGFTLTQIEMILKEMAKLHAASLVMNESDPKKLEELPKTLVDIIYNQDDLKESQNMNILLAIKIMQELEDTPKNQKIIALLEDMTKTVQDKQRSVVNKNRPLRVINHGDTWGNNILMGETDVKLIDLQIMRFTAVSSDLSYFLYINLKPSIRRENINRLLTIYLNALNENIKSAGCNLENDLTMEWLSTEMDDFAVIGFISALWLLPVFYFQKDDLNMDDFTEEQFNNIDWTLSKCTPEYKERLIEIVVEYYENNVY